MNFLIRFFFKIAILIVKKYNKIYRTMLRYVYTYYALSKSTKCGGNLRVNCKSSFDGTIVFGNNCNFNGIVVQGGGIAVFGNNFHSGFGCVIVTSNHNYDNGAKIPYDETFVLKKVVIEDNVWIGNNVMIVGNVTIGEGAIVAAGSVVCRDVMPCSIVGGNPAKLIKMRDLEHYNKLKEHKSFF